MNKKSIYYKLTTAFVCTAFLYGCSGQSSVSENNTSAEQVKASIIGNKAVKTAISEVITYDNDDTYTEWKNGNPNYIQLSVTNASLKGSGAAAKQGKITITAAGVYVISGKLENGQIVVDVQNKGTVRLVLNGAEIKSSDNAPIYVKNAGKTIISLEAGTENIITDGTKYTLEDSSTDEPSAAIFSKDNLVINGSGKLTVKANYNDGITSKDDLKITGGNIKITSVDDGLVGRDILAVKKGTITIEAGGDAIKSSNDEDNTKGIIAIENGTFNLKAEKDGIQAETAVLIADSSFNINSGGGSVNGTKKAEGNMRGARGPMGGKDNNFNRTPPTENDNTNSDKTATAETETESKKAIKAISDIGIAGGTFNIDSADDSIHSNNNAIIEKGNFTITSGDDGIHADATLSIKGGKINITKSYEGIESAVITISDGDIHVTSSDDGINAAGGADGSNKININGGYIVINASGDGLDANGSIYMTKGTVVAYGPTSNGNGVLDYDGTFDMTGGFLVAAGSSGMIQTPSDSSTQYSIEMTYPQIQAAGTLVNLQNSKGKSIATFAPIKDYQAVIISSPELKKGESYTLYSGGSSTTTATDGLYTNAKYENGTKVVSFTISSSVTWLNESGVTTAKSSMPGGGRGGKGEQRGQRPIVPQDQASPAQ